MHSTEHTELNITDSIYPLHDRHAVFRLELEVGSPLVCQEQG